MTEKSYRAKDGVTAWRYPGTLEGAPDWVDREWLTHDNGPALAVPVGDRESQPYTTQNARVGDYIIVNRSDVDPAFDRFKVLTAAEMGEKYDTSEDAPIGAHGDMPNFRPPQETSAQLSDLVKTGTVDAKDMDPEAKDKLQDQLVQQGKSAETAARVAGDEDEPEQKQKARKK